MFNRVSWNILIIGSGISAAAFGFSLLSTTKLNTPLQYKQVSFNKSTIESFDDIEDLEFTKGCRFYFYDSKKVSTEGIKSARNYKIGVDKTKMFSKVKEKINDCTKGRYFYIKPEA